MNHKNSILQQSTRERIDNRLVFIDMLRGASILYIVGFWHLMNYTPVFRGYKNSLTLRGTVIVLGIFVFLSGYLLGQRTIEPSKAAVRAFYVKRFLRIYPLYIGALVLFAIFHLSDKITLLKSGLLISNFYGPQLPTLWFITMLMVFHLMAPVLICSIKYRNTFFVYGALIFCLLVLASMFSIAGDSRVAIYFPAFVSGIYLANLKTRRPNLMLILSFIGFSCSIILSFAVRNFPEDSYWSIPLACFGPIFIFLCLLRCKEYVPNWKLFYILGYAAYVMYLIHRPAFQTMMYLIRRMANTMHLPMSGVAQLVYLVFICLPLIILVSWIVQKSYDNALLLTTSYLKKR